MFNVRLGRTQFAPTVKYYFERMYTHMNNPISPVIKRSAAVFLACAMLLAAGCSKKDDKSGKDGEKTSAHVTVDGTKFMVGDKELWINGVNTPWHYWNDFSGSMNYDFWDKTFEQLAADGVNCTRIWVNCNGENIVRLKSTGEIKNINEEHWNNLDSLFEIAEKHGVYVMPTLLSFDHFKGEGGSPDKWRAMIQSKEMCDSFAENYVAEFCKRYGDNEYLFGIDLMNEPDWVYENDECGKIDWEYLSYFFGRCAAEIHEDCDALVTVGLGIIKYNSDKYEGNKISDEYLKELTGNDKAYVDFYSTHFYMWEAPYYDIPFAMTPEDFGLDGTKPVVIGETSNDDEAQCGFTLPDKYKACYDNGWNGLMVWMEPQEDDTWYRYDLTQEATKAMLALIPEKIRPAAEK